MFRKGWNKLLRGLACLFAALLDKRISCGRHLGSAGQADSAGQAQSCDASVMHNSNIFGHHGHTTIQSSGPSCLEPQPLGAGQILQTGSSAQRSLFKGRNIMSINGPSRDWGASCCTRSRGQAARAMPRAGCHASAIALCSQAASLHNRGSTHGGVQQSSAPKQTGSNQ